MINSKEPLTGVIETDNRAYSFYLKNYSMVFLDAIVNSSLTSILKPVDKFAQAVTHDGHKMLLYIGNHDYPVVNTMKLGLSSYIQSRFNVLDSDLSYYDGIEFVGGTLSQVKRPRAIRTRHDTETGRTYIEDNDDTQSFVFSTDTFTCEVKIGSYTIENYGLHGKSITNDRVYFKMMFNERQPTATVYWHYNKVCELLSFLTNRKSVGVEEVYLWQKDVQVGPSKSTMRTANVYINQQVAYSKKEPYHNLEFELLGDSVGNLLTILYSQKEKKKAYSLGFYPEDDEHSSTINNQIVRDVCSALECEISFVKDIKNEEAKKIKQLKKDLQVIIDKHKMSEDRLKDKTYSLIESNMSHWSMAASDQIKALFHLYDEEMQLIAEKSLMSVGDDEIDSFVKYRNDITHGSYRVLDHKIAFTTHLLACLVYCCILTRIGVSRENIKQWFHDSRLLR